MGLGTIFAHFTLAPKLLCKLHWKWINNRKLLLPTCLAYDREFGSSRHYVLKQKTLSFFLSETLKKCQNNSFKPQGYQSDGWH